MIKLFTYFFIISNFYYWCSGAVIICLQEVLLLIIKLGGSRIYQEGLVWIYLKAPAGQPSHF